MLRVSILLLLLSGTATLAYAQDSLKKTIVVKKATVAPAKSGAIPINPKTGKPYSRYGYGAYAKTYKATKAGDSLNKTTTPPVTTSVAPAPVAAAPVDKSLRSQYQYLLTKVYGYQQPFVAALWKNVMDTLNTNRRQLKEANAKLTDQQKTVSGLQADVATKDQSLNTSNSLADSISFLGIILTKSTYNLMMWGLVIIFGATAAVVIMRSGSNKTEAEYRTKLYNELEEEHKAYKAKTNEKEKKLARELQTERNKVDELMGRG
jgi:hypothetical protein